MKNNARGFTLVETMIAMFVISVVLLALASLLITNMKAAGLSEKRMDNAGLASAVMRNVVADLKLKGKGYTQAMADAAMVGQLQGVSDIYTSSTVTLLAADGTTTSSEGTTLVTVNIAWTHRGVNQILTLRSAVASYNDD